MLDYSLLTSRLLSKSTKDKNKQEDGKEFIEHITNKYAYLNSFFEKDPIGYLDKAELMESHANLYEYEAPMSVLEMLERENV